MKCGSLQPQEDSRYDQQSKSILSLTLDTSPQQHSDPAGNPVEGHNLKAEEKGEETFPEGARDP